MDKSYFNIIILFILAIYFIIAPFIQIINVLGISLGFSLFWGFFFLFAGILDSYNKTLLSNKQFKILLLLMFITGVLTFIYLFTGFNSNYTQIISILLIIVIVLVLFAVDYLINKREVSKFKKGTELLDDLKYEEALKYFDEYLENSPNNPLALSGKAITLTKLNKNEEALKYSNKSLDIKLGITKYPAKHIINSIRFNIKGVVLSNLKMYNEALNCYDIVLKLSPGNFGAWNNKGIVLDNLGRYEEAMECFNKALHFNSKHPYALSNKGETLRKMEKCQEAMEYIDKALELNSKLPFVWLTKGKTLIKMKKYDEGLECINKALELDPIFEDALEAKEKVLKLI